jgi:hypothetical protein
VVHETRSGTLLICYCCERAAHRQCPGFDFLNQVRPSVSTQARKHISSVGAAFDLRTGPRTFGGVAVRQEDRPCVASVFPANALRYRVAAIAALPNEPSEGHAAVGLCGPPSRPDASWEGACGRRRRA